MNAGCSTPNNPFFCSVLTACEKRDVLCETYMYSFLLPSCKSPSGKGRGLIQHVTSIYLDVRSAG